MRGVGRTTNMIHTLPHDRCIIVSPSSSISREIKSLVEDLRSKEFAKKVKFVYISDEEDLYKLMGLSGPVFFDHSFFDGLVDEDVVRKTMQSAITSGITYNIGKTK